MTTVLIVDDLDFVADALCTLLDFLGYAPLRARSAEEGLTLFHVARPCAVITDNRMGCSPDDSAGLNLARHIKQAAPHTPVIMVSAIPPSGAAGVCDAVLSKPVRIRDLQIVLQRLGVYPPERPAATDP